MNAKSLLFSALLVIAACADDSSNSAVRKEEPSVVTVEPENASPVPTAPLISILVNTSGTSQIEHNDPTTGDTHSYAVTEPAVHGVATVDGAGLVTYVPSENYFGEDRVVVTVTDSAGNAANVEIPIGVGAIPYTGPGSVVKFCGDGEFRVGVLTVSPARGTLFTPSTSVDFTANLSFSVPETTVVDVSYQGNPVTSVTVNGCGTRTLSWTTLTPATAAEMQFTVSLTGDVLYYYAGDNDDFANLRIVSSTLPAEGVISEMQYDFFATWAWDLKGDLAYNYATWFEIDEQSGDGNWYPYWAPIVNSGNVTMRMRGLVACETEISFNGYIYGPNVKQMTQRFIYPARKLPLYVEDFYTRMPLAGKDLTVNVAVNDCTGDSPTVAIVPSAPWFSADVTQLTLPGDFQLTYHADQIPDGTEVKGTLTFSSIDNGFNPVTMKVSAVDHSLELTDYTRAACTFSCQNDDDDAYEVPLSFAFPSGSFSSNAVTVNSNGTIFFAETSMAAESNNGGGSFNTLDPDYFGVPFVALMWSDNGFWDDPNGADAMNRDDGFPSGAYYREVTDVTGHHAEIVIWDMHAISWYATHFVFRVKLYPSGAFTVEPLQVDPIGMEDFGTFTQTGVATLIPALDIVEGHTYQYGKIAP